MNSVETIKALLGEMAVDPASPRPPAVQKAILLARRLQERATQLQTPSERRQQAELDRMLQTPSDKSTLAQMTDQAFRASDPHRAVDHLVHILDVQGVPRFFNPWERTLLKGFQSFGGYAPGVALPLVKEHMQKETANVILPGEKPMLTHHLRERTREGVRMNVNFLGEAILGEQEAERRLQAYLQALQWPEIEVVSIKISTLYSQISALAREHTVSVLCDRLERLFRTAARMTFRRPDGTTVPKFVYLDMEEYRDKELTAEAFMRTLDRSGLEGARAGIALQSYVPDMFETLQRIGAWARRRVAAGGGRITIRLVKGANMEMERVEASIRGWPQAPYRRKIETDANYRRMVHEVMRPENLAAMDVGIASHNVFELAYGLVLAAEAEALGQVQFEMLEGMANHQRRALFEATQNLLLYAPACRKENFINAIGYLVRRLDENTGPDNFLRHAFRIQVQSPEWTRLEQQFLEAFDAIPSCPTAPRRTQDRQRECPPQGGSTEGDPVAAAARPAAGGPEPAGGKARGPVGGEGDWARLANEPDTDFALPHNGEWGQRIVEAWQDRCGARAPRIPAVVAGEEVYEGRTVRDCLDPSRPGVVAGRHAQASAEDVLRAIECAVADPDGWREMSPAARSAVLGRVAEAVRGARADLMGAALADGGKTLMESDPEVSEAVDFLEFYRAAASWWYGQPTLEARPRGVVVVVSPWNFPIAIPCGGVAAALAAGNTVIFKPASDTVLVAWELCQCFWRAGVSRRVLQFLPCAGGREGKALVSDPRVGAVILTGGTDTALAMLEAQPRLHLCAETGGKDATIVTALSDRDQAIKHVLHSAFSHSGQKCSATSLLLLEAEVYDSPEFRRTLVDAVESLAVGSAWDLATKMGPLIRPPAGDLETALKVLEPGEEWAVMPEPRAGNPNLWSPGVKYGVRPGSFTHQTEFFGPVLGVMRFEKLSEAVAWVNQTGYGLTSGLESLDEREWDYWLEHLEAGNLYVNRVTTGAVVLRQPFGGFGKSVFGPGMKAGGPNYVAQFMEFRDRSLPAFAAPEDPNLKDLCERLRRQVAGAAQGESALAEDEVTRILSAVASSDRARREEFSQPHDHFRLLGQDNLRRYRPYRAVRVRVHADDSPFEIFARAVAAYAAGARVTVSSPRRTSSVAVSLLEALTQEWGGAIEFVEEEDEELVAAIAGRQTDRLRYAHPARVPGEVLLAAARANVGVVSVPVVAEGRLEMLWAVREQSISIDYHRYGNLGPRVTEPRAEPA